MLRKPLIPEATLKTRDANHSRFTAISEVVVVCWNENWSEVAVMLEKKVAIVVRVRYRVVTRSSSSDALSGRANSGSQSGSTLKEDNWPFVEKASKTAATPESSSVSSGITVEAIVLRLSPTEAFASESACQTWVSNVAVYTYQFSYSEPGRNPKQNKWHAVVKRRKCTSTHSISRTGILKCPEREYVLSLI